MAATNKRPQCGAAALVDRRARAAQCQAARIQIEFKNSSNGFKFCPTFDRHKKCLPLLEKIEIKYG
jgi:hypothetical protein